MGEILSRSNCEENVKTATPSTEAHELCTLRTLVVQPASYSIGLYDLILFYHK